MSDDILSQIYYDPKQGFLGVNNLYRAIKKLVPKVTMKEVQQWLNKQAVAQIHKRMSDKIDYMPIFSYSPGSFQMDLTEMPVYVKQNRGYRYILTVININTRKLYAYKSKKKTATEIRKLLDKWRKDVDIANRVTTDAGSEFKGNRKWFEDNNIELTIVNPRNKFWVTGKIERVHRTLKELFDKYFTAMNTVKWYDMLDAFVENYNNRYHTAIKMSPNEVDAEKEREIIWNDMKRLRKVQQTKTPFMKGNYVRIKIKKGIFEKGENLFSDEIYQITKVNPLGTYQVSDLEGKRLNQTFKDYQLQYVGRTKDDIKNLTATTRSNVRKAQKEKRATNRFNREGLDQSNIRQEQLRTGRATDQVWKTKRRKRKPKKPVEVYEIERLVRQVKRGRKIFYEVKWKGYRDTTIEPRSNLMKDVPEMVREYENKL